VKRRRWSAIAIASVLVPVAFSLAFIAIVSQITWFGSEPTHEERAVLLFVVAAGLILVSFAVLAGGLREAPDDDRAYGLRRTTRVVEATGAAVVGGFLASALFLQFWDNLVYPLVFAVAVGAAFALPRRTPVLLVARVAAVFALLTLTGWADHRIQSQIPLLLGVVLALPAVGAADVLLSWRPEPRFVALAVVIALLPAGLVLWVREDDSRRREQAAAYQRAHPLPPPASIGHDRILWRAAVPAHVGISAGPVFASGRLVYTGYDGHVHALDATDGSEVWSAPADVTSNAEIAVAEGVVLVPGAHLAAHDLSTGKLLWRTPDASGYAGTPVVAGRVAVVAGADGGPLVGRDLHDGRQLWKLDSPPMRLPRFKRRFETPVLASGLLIAWTEAPNPQDGSALFAIHPSTGAVLWTRSFPNLPEGVVRLGGRIVFCAGYNRFSLDVRTGRTLGRDDKRCFYRKVPGLSHIGISSGYDGIAAVDLADTHELWRKPLPVDLTYGARAIADGSVVYVPSTDAFARSATGSVRAFDAKTGRQLWRVDVDGGVTARPAVTDNALVVASAVDCRTTPCGATIYAIRR
jgi:outer membrane protein assembly factor BamB